MAEFKSQIAKDLHAAAEFLKDKEHIKGEMGDGTKTSCLFHAIARGAGHDSWESASEYEPGRFKDAVDHFKDHVGRSVCGFNNNDATTKESAIAALQEAATKAEAKFLIWRF